MDPGTMIEGASKIMTAFNGCIGTVSGIVNSYRSSRNSVRSQYWENLGHSLAMLSELVPVHVEAIKHVRDLIVQERDLVQASQAFTILVQNDKLAFAYDSVRGVLEESSKLPAFGPHHLLIGELIARLRVFERAAFTIEPGPLDPNHPPSIIKMHALNSAAYVIDLLTSNDRSEKIVNDINAHATFVLQQFNDDVDYQWFGGPDPLFDSSGDVLSTISVWAESWLQRTRAPLYGKGLNSRIDALLFHRPPKETPVGASVQSVESPRR